MYPHYISFFFFKCWKNWYIILSFDLWPEKISGYKIVSNENYNWSICIWILNRVLTSSGPQFSKPFKYKLYLNPEVSWTTQMLKVTQLFKCFLIMEEFLYLKLCFGVQHQTTLIRAIYISYYFLHRNRVVNSDTKWQILNKTKTCMTSWKKIKLWPRLKTDHKKQFC